MKNMEFCNVRPFPLTLSLSDGSHFFIAPKARAMVPVGLAGSADVNAARLRGDLVVVTVHDDQPAPPAAPEPVAVPMKSPAAPPVLLPARV